MGHSHTNLLYHIVFSTKERQPWLDTEISTRLYPYVGGAIRSEGGVGISINGCPDHIHILAKLKQDKAVSDVLRAIKANSSGWIHRTFYSLRGFAWQSGYGAFSVSQSQVDKVEHYIANQQVHHQRVSFKEEFIALLDAHGIEYDEEYLWD
ncbi:MAG: IS200/IS605 family transposase [Acidobacteriota bacterium]